MSDRTPRVTMTYEELIAEMRALGGTFSEVDYFPPDRRPYRHASVEVRCDAPADYEPTLLKMARIAVESGAHLYFWTHYTPVAVGMSIGRDLEPDEIGTGTTECPSSTTECPSRVVAR